ncbi:MAG: hypothetical protein Q9170_000457 [Blastenia crenularia]
MNGPRRTLLPSSRFHRLNPHPLRLEAFLLALANIDRSHHDYSIWSGHRPRALSPGCIIPVRCVKNVFHSTELVNLQHQNALSSRLGWAENGRFIEQFRYTIIASQLLNDVSNPSVYKRQTTFQSLEAGDPDMGENRQIVDFSWLRLSLTALAAFTPVWSIHWTRNAAPLTSRIWPLFLVLAAASILCCVIYVYLRRQWLQRIRGQAVESASTLVAGAQTLDAAISASINLIQEVELVCRGYRITSPLPPVTRMDERSQARRCAGLREVLRRVFISLPASYHTAFEEMKALAIGADLEMYYDIYDISRSEMLEAEELQDVETLDLSNEDTLKAFKVGLQKLHLARKLFFCSSLALSADGGKVDFAKWSTATKIIDALIMETRKTTQDFDEILGTEEDLLKPITPVMPLTPGRERIRSQIWRLTSLSQGIRGLQARMQLLREDADKVAGDSSTTLASRYESFGNNLRELLEEWQEGQAVFKSTTYASKNRLSLPAMPRTTPSSPTMSLGGSTAVEGSPPDALRALNGYGSCHRSSSSTATSSAGEEIFEAIALPRQRSTLNREERIAKMKEDRIRQAMAKSKAEASSHMLKELETVIKLRPRGRTTGRMGSI